MHPKLSCFLSRHLIDRKNGHRRAVLAAFSEKQQWAILTPEKKLGYVNRKLADLLNHARSQVPRYRELLGKKSIIDAANARDALASLPVMTRTDIQSDQAAFLAEDAGRMMDDATGGSSGTPMRFKVDEATQISRESSLYWSDSLAGWKYGERIAMLWGSDKDVKSATQEMRASLRWCIDNRRWYNAFDMGEERMMTFHEDMMLFRPHIIVAYAGSAAIFAQFLQERNLQPAYPLRAVISSAEMLTSVARQTIESVFKKPVFDRYGNREFGAIAAECSSHEGMHVNESDFVLEIDRQDSSHEPGNLLVTYLHNRAMPFLRYDTGDLTRFSDAGPCTCGRDTLKLAAISGRQADTIKTASGKLIHGEFFTHLLYSFQHVREFQFIQETLHRYRILLVASEKNDAMESRLKIAILEEIGRGSELSIEYVNVIPVLPSGKRKFTLSKLSS